MSDKKTHSEQIDKYLKGKLDARAMHKLEREAQDDPFLMDALDGYEGSGEQDANLTKLKGLLDKRIAPKKERSIILWRVLPIAACLLIALTVGYWYFAPQKVNQQYAAVIKPDKIIVKPASPQAAVVTQPKESPVKRFTAATAIQQPIIPQPQLNKTLATVSIVGTNSIVYKTDTVEYRASDYKVRENKTVDELLKHMEGFQVDSNGSVTHQGQAVTKARLNGRDYSGGNLAQAIQSLPADIVEKIQVVDDYGDQASRTGVKDGDPSKILNITTDSAKRKLVAANAAAKPPVLRQAKINDKNPSATPPNVLTNALSGKVAGVTVNPNISTSSSNRIVTGLVVDQTGQPLMGAAVRLNGAANGITTDAKGTFEIKVPANNETLNVASIGYVGKQVKVGDQANVKIALDDDQKALNEVSITGYGTQAKRGVTGSNADKNAQPVIGIKAYDAYLKEIAIMPDNSTGAVELGFTVAADGAINNIRVISGKNKAMSDKAVEILKNGPKWIAGNEPKETRLTIVFRKKE